jgi:hypothetical protein
MRSSPPLRNCLQSPQVRLLHVPNFFGVRTVSEDPPVLDTQLLTISRGRGLSADND